MKLKFLITSLTSCSGCVSSLISLDFFSQFLEKTELCYFPFLEDNQLIDDQDYDIALIEGCVSTDSQIEFLKKIRKNSKKIIALGTCAAFGGILSLSKERFAIPLQDVVEINGIIPGCPPPTKLFGNCLIKLLERKEIELPKKNLCDGCPNKTDFILSKETIINKIIPDNKDLFEEGENCFLKKGVLCLGPITRQGCDYECIKAGMPCEGCMGPVSKDITSNIINFLSLANVSKDLKKYKGLYYRFSKPKIWRS
ncbi:MAG: hypothetical protein JW891_04850 [Candidatus Lokiarchaeota archaeon]|nr:hypothetical protein [Candidatus Lokiarchaeota archaeon]